MKKIFAVFFAVLVLFALAIPCFAEEEQTTEIVETTDKFYEKWIDNLTSSSFWVTVVAVVTAAVTVIASVGQKVGSIKSLFPSGAKPKEIVDNLAALSKDLIEEFEKVKKETEAKADEYREMFEAAENNRKRAELALTLFFQYAKINENAKAEILKVMNGYTDISASVSEIVETVKEAVVAADAVEEKAKTPALDAIVAEVKQTDEVGVI